MGLKDYFLERPELIEELNACRNLAETERTLIDNVKAEDLKKLIEDRNEKLSLQDMMQISGGTGIQGSLNTVPAIQGALSLIANSLEKK